MKDSFHEGMMLRCMRLRASDSYTTQGRKGQIASVPPAVSVRAAIHLQHFVLVVHLVIRRGSPKPSLSMALQRVALKETPLGRIAEFVLHISR